VSANTILNQIDSYKYKTKRAEKKTKGPPSAEQQLAAEQARRAELQAQLVAAEQEYLGNTTLIKNTPGQGGRAASPGRGGSPKKESGFGSTGSRGLNPRGGNGGRGSPPSTALALVPKSKHDAGGPYSRRGRSASPSPLRQGAMVASAPRPTRRFRHARLMEDELLNVSNSGRAGGGAGWGGGGGGGKDVGGVREGEREGRGAPAARPRGRGPGTGGPRRPPVTPPPPAPAPRARCPDLLS
jgi:hypothetical protein